MIGKAGRLSASRGATVLEPCPRKDNDRPIHVDWQLIKRILTFFSAWFRQWLRRGFKAGSVRRCGNIALGRSTGK
jgi:hypothetical protein